MEKTKPRETEVAQAERFGLGDWTIAAGLAVLTFLAARFWEFPGLHPAVWNDAAVAAGVRPAAGVVPGFWTAVASVVYSVFGIGAATEMLRLAGHLVLAGVAGCVYAVLREWLALAMRMRPQIAEHRTLVMRLASALGAAAFVSADPVWNWGQCLSETTILMGLTLAAVGFFFVFLRKGTLKYAYFSAFMLGLLAAETPMGFFLAPFLVVVNYVILEYIPVLDSPLFKPAVMMVGKWYLSLVFLAAFSGGLALNCWTFLRHGGVEAVGGSVGDVPLEYLLGYWARLADAADPWAWLLWIGVAILPFLVATVKFPKSADDERFLSYASGLVFFVCGTLMLCQSSSLSSLWFWTHFPMNSQYLLSIGLFCCATTLALSLAILGVESLCRDHRRLAQRFFGDPLEGEEDEAREASQTKEPRPKDVPPSASKVLFRRLGVVVIPLLVLAIMLPGRVKKTTCAMLEVICDSVQEIVREAGDAKYLFTDGALDAAIELEAARIGSPLRCYALMNAGPLSVYLRTRNLADEEDLFSFKFDSAMGLRSWIRDKPERLAKSAALMGFDLWKRDGKPLPSMGGLLSRPTGFADEAERLRGVAAAQELAARTMAVHRMKGGAKTCTDAFIKRAFFCVQWRLARMCLYRSEVDDRKGLVDSAIAEVTLSKTLNDCNEIYQDLVKAMEKRDVTMLQKVTPREGLQLALARANFTMGRAYAEPILTADPDNSNANFAMGMHYLEKRQFSRAEQYLLRCLVRKPNEPAVYNNLAMIQIELGKYKEARANIEKALELIPDSAAVLDTKKALETALEAEK